MKYISIIIFLLPILTFGQKQGVYIGYSGSSVYERTYRNDTLNGALKEYSKEGILRSIGYWVNGKYDGLRLEFYPDRTVKEIENFKNGLHNGERIKYYPSGHIKYFVNYKNDTIIGDEITYYENGIIRFLGNRKNGEYKVYYPNGNLKSIQHFENRKIIGNSTFYSIDGDKLLPLTLAQRLVDDSDSIILNNTDLSVYQMFNSRDSINSFVNIDGLEFENIVICNNYNITIHIGGFHLYIYKDHTVVKESYDTLCNESIKYTRFTTNSVIKEQKNGDFDINYKLEKRKYRVQLGKVIVDRRQMGCQDTGDNPITLYRNRNQIQFKKIGNVIFFEFDINKDGIKELYILNYYTCENRLEVYKIDIK